MYKQIAYKGQIIKFNGGNNKVAQVGGETTNADYEILLSGTSDDNYFIGETRKTASLTYNPSSQSLEINGSPVLTQHQDISGKVSKSGDTMSGILTINKANSNYYISKTDTYARSTSSNNGISNTVDIGGLLFRDKNDANLGDVHLNMYTDGSNDVEIFTNNTKTDGNTTSASLHIRSYKDGSGLVYTGNNMQSATLKLTGGRVLNSGDDEGLVIDHASNNWAGVCLGNPSGLRSVFYLNKSTKACLWRYNNGSSSYDINHPGKAGTIALTSDLSSYLPLTGGNLSGNTFVSKSAGESDIGAKVGNNSIYLYCVAGGGCGIYTAHKGYLLDWVAGNLLQIGRTDGGMYLRNGEVSVGNGAFNAYRAVKASAFNVQSSKLVKENIKPITDDEAKKLLDIDVVTFDYKENFGGDKGLFGVIAEDTVNVIPSVVSIPDGYDEKKFDESKGINQPIISVDYAKFVPHLIKMIQIQEERIKELEAKL